MAKEIMALLVCAEGSPFPGLQTALEGQSVSTRQVKSCAEAKNILHQEKRSTIVFTDTKLPDGAWTDVLKTSREESDHAEVVVVSRQPDVDLYLNVMERGAFDFIAPPFAPAELAHVVRCATHDPANGWRVRSYLAASA